MDDREYSLMEHLAELRGRLGKALIGVAIVAIAAFWVSDQILSILREPMDRLIKEAHGSEARFVVIAPAEYLICQMKAAFVAGIFIASPWVLYQIWLFISPGLYPHEKRYVTAFVWAGAVCFCGGAVFAYFAVFPTMFEFLVGNQPADVLMTLSIAEHFSFTLKMLLAFGVVFETPVVIFILSVAGIIDPHALGKYRKYVVVIAFIVGAILTPTPDILSQLMLAGPLLVLYEVGVFVSKIAVKVSGTPLSRKERADQYDAAHPEDAAKRAAAEAVEAAERAKAKAKSDTSDKSEKDAP